MPPTKGRIVMYAVTEQDIAEIAITDGDQSGPSFQHNPIYEGELVAAVVVRVFEDGVVNLRGLIDGNGALPWWTSRREGTTPGTWRWPERVS
jgi:hypothetical protein